MLSESIFLTWKRGTHPVHPFNNLGPKTKCLWWCQARTTDMNSFVPRTHKTFQPASQSYLDGSLPVCIWILRVFDNYTGCTFLFSSFFPGKFELISTVFSSDQHFDSTRFDLRCALETKGCRTTVLTVNSWFLMLPNAEAKRTKGCGDVCKNGETDWQIGCFVFSLCLYQNFDRGL